MKKTLLILSLFYSLSYSQTNNDPEFKLQINNSGNYYQMKGSLKLGLGDNLLSGVKEDIYKKIDDSVDPLIKKLKQLQEKNMKTFNTETYTGNTYSSNIGKSFTKLIGVDTTSKSTKKFKEKYKGGIGGFIFNNKKFSADTGGLNPFADFNKKFQDKISEINSEITSFSKVSDFVNSKLEDPIKTFDKYRKIDLKNLTENLLDTGSKNSASKQYLIDIASGKNSNVAFNNYYKKAYPNYFPEKSKVSFDFENRLPKTNNMCDITKCLFGDCDSLSAAEKQDFESKVEKLRKQLLKKAIYVMAKKLIQEFYINEYIQYAQRAMSCSVEASMAVTLDTMGFGVPITSTSGISNVKMNGSKSATNGQSVKDSSKKTADCLRIDDYSSKTEENKDTKFAANAQGEGVDFYGLTASIWEPLMALGGEFKLQTDKPVKEFADKEHVNSCILQGKTITWKNSFNTCMETGETTEVKFNAKLQIMIQNLFEKLRKHKKLQCELSKELAKSEKLHFSLLKYSDMIPSLIETDYNNHSSSGFMDAVAYLLNKDIKINKIITDNQVCMDSVLTAKENNTQKSCSLTVNSDSFSVDSNSSNEDIDKSFKDFCNSNGEYFLSLGNVKELMKTNNDFKKKAFPIISDINYCSTYFKEKFIKPTISYDKVPMKTLYIETLLEMKYRYEDQNNFNQNMFQNYLQTFDYMSNLSYQEKITICENKNAYNTPLMLVGKKSKNHNDIYQNNYIESAIGKFCNAFKNEIINKELNKALNDFDTPNLDIGEINDEIKSVEKELIKYRGN